MGGSCSTNGGGKEAIDSIHFIFSPILAFTNTLLVGKPEGKRPLGRPRCRWVNNIRMDLGRGGLG
jgi:hypothetical protein